MLSSAWLENHSVQYELQKIGDTLGRDLEVEGVSGFQIRYIGYTILGLLVGDCLSEVPFLVSSEQIGNPIHWIQCYLISNNQRYRNNDGSRSEEILQRCG